MTPPQPDFRRLLAAGENHLEAACPALRRLIHAYGPCRLTPEPDLFRTLVRAMIAQLISTAAARTITARLECQVNGQMTPQQIMKLSDEEFQRCGISGGKRRAIRELAAHFLACPDFGVQVQQADDATVRQRLLPLRGVGPWTVDMVLMFGLGRPDIWPVGDLGLRAGVRALFVLPDLPDSQTMIKVAEPWRPYRTIASWYLWRSRGWVPQSGNNA
jgi:DNA-3-methyladenine glycosylase II